MRLFLHPPVAEYVTSVVRCLTDWPTMFYYWHSLHDDWLTTATESIEAAVLIADYIISLVTEGCTTFCFKTTTWVVCSANEQQGSDFMLQTIGSTFSLCKFWPFS